jgi:hypothetical protein
MKKVCAYYLSLDPEQYYSNLLSIARNGICLMDDFFTNLYWNYILNYISSKTIIKNIYFSKRKTYILFFIVNKDVRCRSPPPIRLFENN